MVNASMAAGRRILIVEDDYHVATSLALNFEVDGAAVVGPVASVKAALAIIEVEHIDGAVLDVNLNGEMVYPVADALRQKGLPFVFVSGYDARSVESRFADVPWFEKPATPMQLVEALFG